MPRPTSLLLTLFAALSGCASAPAFRAELPRDLPLEGRTLAIVADLQMTSGFVRLVRHRENNKAAQRVLIDDLYAHVDELGALVIVGDLVYSARSANDWAHFDTLVAPFAERMPVLPAIGNHDYPCRLVRWCDTSVIAPGMSERFPWFVPGQPYAVAAGDLLLLFIDSESALDVQGQWLESELAAAAGRYRKALVFFHRPAYTNSIDRGAVGNVDVETHIVPRLRAAALPVIVFNGHIHGYEYLVRDGVPYVTTAGGGGPRGLLGAERPDDRYAGPDCRLDDDGEVLRPLNYLLLRQTEGGTTIEVRGFCGTGDRVRVLDTISIAD